MKRYLLFAGDAYYPGGGSSDLEGDFDTREEAIKALHLIRWDWAQVLDTHTGEWEGIEEE